MENLAIAYSLDEVKIHGQFLDRLVEPVNGFIILDLHNLYCQLHNFDLDFEDIIDLYPLHRVREIHISGGSWDDLGMLFRKKIRRDTHDDAVPEAVFYLLEQAVSRCPNLKYVVLEQLGSGLDNEDSREQFQWDFERMTRIVDAANQPEANAAPNAFLPTHALNLGSPVQDERLHAQQLELSNILETAAGAWQAQEALAASSLANSDWRVEAWRPEMLETVLRIARKWKAGFV